MHFEYIKTDHSPTAFRLKELSVFFSDERCLEIIEKVLDEKGNILNFPGILEDERWRAKQNVGLCPDVRYEAQFHCLDEGKFLMLWMTQPSGWHWVDEDGFGFSGDSPITLYSVLDANGNFEKQFALFRIGETQHCQDYDSFLR